MLKIKDIDDLVHSRLADADALFSASRYDGAIYLCGYAIELKLKSRICQTLGWEGFPSSNNEFRDLSSFKTHNLDILLKLSGKEPCIRNGLSAADWSIVSVWNPESRYTPSSATQQDAQSMLDATRNLMVVL